MGVLPQESWGESTDGKRNNFTMGYGVVSRMMFPACFEERGADQDVGQGRLPGRGGAGPSLQDENGGGVWMARMEYSSAQHSQGHVFRSLGSCCCRGQVTIRGEE